MKIIKEDLEFDEIYKGKVKPIATGGYIPFFKRFIGRIIHVIIPKQEMGFWLFDKQDLIKLKEKVKGINFPEPYSRQREEHLVRAINAILKSPDNFELDHLRTIINGYGLEKDSLVLKIKKTYDLN